MTDPVPEDRSHRHDAELEAYARDRDPVVRDRLAAAHLGLVHHLARRFSGRGEPLDDLVQVGSLGLLKALERFDPVRGVAFSTFATATIVGELKRHFRDKGWALKVSRSVQELHVRLQSEVEFLSQELQRAPTVAELAEAVEATEEAVLNAMEAGRSYRTGSLDRPDDDNAGEWRALGADDPALQVADDRLSLVPSLTVLPKREQLIVYLRFYEELTQSEIAARLGISQMHVSRLLARSLAMLRDATTPG